MVESEEESISPEIWLESMLGVCKTTCGSSVSCENVKLEMEEIGLGREFIRILLRSKMGFFPKVWFWALSHCSGDLNQNLLVRANA